MTDHVLQTDPFKTMLKLFLTEHTWRWTGSHGGILNPHMRNLGSTLDTAEDTDRTSNSSESKPGLEKWYQQI